MSARPQTIQIFLPQGDPRGIRMAEITTRILQVIEVPRSLVGDFLQMPEAAQVALYVLVGEDDGGQPTVYIGQTGDLITRLKSHNREKEFWERALVVVSRTNSLTQTHALFLEWFCLNALRTVGRYTDENGNAGSQPFTPAPLKADCEEMFDTAKVILATLGYPLFEPIARAEAKDDADELFYCTGSGAKGTGLYTPEGFVVLQGSIGRRENVPSIIGTTLEQTRANLITSGVFRVEGDKLVCEKDHLFNSPSMAAIALMGRTANGWVEWKDKHGNTLDALKRKNG